MSHERTPAPPHPETPDEAAAVDLASSQRRDASARGGALFWLPVAAISAMVIGGVLALLLVNPRERPPSEEPVAATPSTPPTPPAPPTPQALPTPPALPTPSTPEPRRSAGPFAGRKGLPADYPLDAEWSDVEGTRMGTIRLPGQTGDYDWPGDGQWLYVLRYDPAELLKIRVPDFRITARLDLRESDKQLSGTTNFACMARCQNGLALLGTRPAFLGPATEHTKLDAEFVVLVDPESLHVLKEVPIPKSMAMAASPEKPLLYLASAGDGREVRVVGADDGRVIASCELAAPPPGPPDDRTEGRIYPRRPRPPVTDPFRLSLRGTMTPDGENLYFCSQDNTWRFETHGQGLQACEVVASPQSDNGMNLPVFLRPDRIGLATDSGVAVVSARNINERQLFIRTDGPVAYDPASKHYWSPASRESLVAFDAEGKRVTELKYGHPRAGNQILVSPRGGAAMVGVGSRIYWLELTALPSPEANEWLTKLRPTDHENNFARKPFPWSRGFPFLWVFGIERGELPAVGLAWSRDGKYLFALSDRGILRRFRAPEFDDYRQLQFRDFACKARFGFGRPHPSGNFGMGMVPYGKDLAVGLDEPVRAVAVVDPESMTVTRVLAPGEFGVLLPSADSDLLFATSPTGIGCLQHPGDEAFTLPGEWTGVVAGQGRYLFAGRRLARYSIRPDGLVKDFQDKDDTSWCPFASADGTRVGHNVNGRYVIRDAETFEVDTTLAGRDVTIDGFSMTHRWALGIGRPRGSTMRALTIFDFDGNSSPYDDPRSETYDPIAVDPLGRGLAIGFQYNQPGIIWMIVE
jgi:hypothetical protein